MPIWHKTPTLDDARNLHQETLVSTLGIEITEINEDSMTATMPVDGRTRQIHGILHGGASVALAETLGSYAATCCVDQENYFCVGLDINANHIRSAHPGSVTAEARPIHLGRKTQVWRIVITDENDRTVCESRLTVAVLEKQEA
jgi:1,4-dihydroxy-2-naphthoyl-CoA hydrolase